MMDGETTLEPIIEQNLDIKREARRFRVYFLYLDGKSQESIAEILTISRDTVIQDLTEIRKRIAERPPWDMETIRQETYMRMIALRNKILADADKVENANSRARLYDVAASLELKILERYTQMGRGTDVRITGGGDMGKAVVDYIKEKFGPEQLTDFISWYERRSKASDRLDEALRS